MSTRSDQARIPPNAGRRRDVEPERISPELRSVFSAFEQAGHEAWLLGPAARELLGYAPAGAAAYADFVVAADRQRIHEVLSGLPELSGQRLAPSRRGFEYQAPVGGAPDTQRRVQVSPLRTSLPPYRSFRDVELSGIALDLATREVTLHAFAIDRTGQVIDPYGGVADLEARLIRTVIPCDRVFTESGMFLLKVARYVAQYGFAPGPELLRFAQRDAGNILDTQRDQWRGYLDRILLAPHARVGVTFLYDSRVLDFLMPEVASMVGFHETCQVHHKDIWDHTLQVVAKADRNLVVRWAALMHDIGKVWTRQVTRGGKVHFFRHEELGALLFEGIAARLRLEAELTERVAYLIRNHSRVNLYEEGWTDSAVRRLIRECGEHLLDLISFSKADFTTKRAWREQELRRQMAELEERIRDIREADARVPPLPTGLGNEMMERFGLTPGPRVGKLKQMLEAAVEAGEVAAHQESAVYLDYLERTVPELTSGGDA